MSAASPARTTAAATCPERDGRQRLQRPSPAPLQLLAAKVIAIRDGDPLYQQRRRRHFLQLKSSAKAATLTTSAPSAFRRLLRCTRPLLSPLMPPRQLGASTVGGKVGQRGSLGRARSLNSLRFSAAARKETNGSHLTRWATVWNAFSTWCMYIPE